MSFLLLVGCIRSDRETTETAGEEEIDLSHTPVISVKEEEFPETISTDILEGRQFEEAPMLKERVSRGQLPPVSLRLPTNPLVTPS